MSKAEKQTSAKTQDNDMARNQDKTPDIFDKIALAEQALNDLKKEVTQDSIKLRIKTFVESLQGSFDEMSKIASAGFITVSDILKDGEVKALLAKFGVSGGGSGGVRKPRKSSGTMVKRDSEIQKVLIAAGGSAKEAELIAGVHKAHPERWSDAEIKETLGGTRLTGDKPFWKIEGKNYIRVKKEAK